jgi:hypothetical protein
MMSTARFATPVAKVISVNVGTAREYKDGGATRSSE